MHMRCRYIKSTVIFIKIIIMVFGTSFYFSPYAPPPNHAQGLLQGLHPRWRPRQPPSPQYRWHRPAAGLDEAATAVQAPAHVPATQVVHLRPLRDTR